LDNLEEDKMEDEELEESDKEGEEKDLLKDGGLKKKILKKGTGYERPSSGADVCVHYVGKLEDGKVFDSSRERNEPFTFKVGKGAVIKGWDEGIITMKKGELAVFTIRSDYGYGKAGSPPKIPADATLIFEVEMISWNDEKDVSDSRDGGILKKTLKEGDGWETPKEDAQVTINYVARREDGSLVEEKNAYQFICGAEEVFVGLDQGVQSMKKGEKALLTIKPEYTHVNQTLKVEVELTDFVKDKESHSMNTQEKFEAAEKAKKEGNVLYQAQNYKRANKKYKKALDIISSDHAFTEEEKQKGKKEMKLPCYLNSAACCMKQQDYKEVINHCNKALEIDFANVKAYFRRATAYLELDEWIESERDFEQVLALDPENKEGKKEFARLKKRIAEQNKKDKSLYSRMFQGVSAK